MIWDFYHFHASQTTLQVLSGKSNFWKGNGLIRHRENHGRKVTKTNYLPTKHGEILVDHYRDSGLFDFSFFFMYRQKHISINFQIYIYIYTYIYTKVLIYESYKTRYFIIIISYINHWPFFCNSLSLSLSLSLTMNSIGSSLQKNTNNLCKHNLHRAPPPLWEVSEVELGVAVALAASAGLA